jgi:hypothetical protein
MTVNFRKIAVVALTALAMLAVSMPAYAQRLEIQGMGVNDQLSLANGHSLAEIAAGPLAAIEIDHAIVCTSLDSLTRHRYSYEGDSCFTIELGSNFDEWHIFPRPRYQFDGHMFYESYRTILFYYSGKLWDYVEHKKPGPDVICLRLDPTKPRPNTRSCLWTFNDSKYIQLRERKG